MSYLLIFHADLRSSSSLLEGRLILFDTASNREIERYIATSGSPGNQKYSDISAKGRGPIPPCTEVGIDHYSVDTTPIFMPQVKGVEGNFFKINPFSVRINGVDRGDFGIHFDANAPGSAGCVVILTANGWEGFQNTMKKLAVLGIKTVDLIVSYVR